MALANFCSSTVLPLYGGATMSPLWPFPTGVRRSITLIEISFGSCSSRKRSFGYSGVRLSKSVLSFASSGLPRFTASTFSSAKYRSPSFGGRICPLTVSPVLRVKRRICDGETYMSSGPGR